MPQTNNRQIELLLRHLEDREDIAQGAPKTTKSDVDDFWEIVAEQLNPFGPPVKDKSGWKKAFLDYKSYVKRKVAQNKALSEGSGLYGSQKECTFNDLEKTIIRLCKLEEVVSAENQGINAGRSRRSRRISRGNIASSTASEISESSMHYEHANESTRRTLYQKDPRRCTTRPQYEVLVDLMTERKDIATSAPITSKEDVQSFWDEVTVQLNNRGPPIKDKTTWKKVWLDYRSFVKRKLEKNKAIYRESGTDGSSRMVEISDLEERVIRICGLDADTSKVARYEGNKTARNGRSRSPSRRKAASSPPDTPTHSECSMQSEQDVDNVDDVLNISHMNDDSGAKDTSNRAVLQKQRFRPNTTRPQYEMLISMLMERQDIARGAPNSRDDLITFWEEVETALNSLGPPIKDHSTWKKVWLDYKSFVKRKAAFINAKYRGEEAPNKRKYTKTILTDMEETVVMICGFEPVIAEAKEAACIDRSKSPNRRACNGRSRSPRSIKTSPPDSPISSEGSMQSTHDLDDVHNNITTRALLQKQIKIQEKYFRESTKLAKRVDRKMDEISTSLREFVTTQQDMLQETRRHNKVMEELKRVMISEAFRDE